MPLVVRGTLIGSALALTVLAGHAKAGPICADAAHCGSPILDYAWEHGQTLDAWIAGQLTNQISSLSGLLPANVTNSVTTTIATAGQTFSDPADGVTYGLASDANSSISNDLTYNGATVVGSSNGGKTYSSIAQVVLNPFASGVDVLTKAGAWDNIWFTAKDYPVHGVPNPLSPPLVGMTGAGVATPLPYATTPPQQFAVHPMCSSPTCVQSAWTWLGAVGFGAMDFASNDNEAGWSTGSNIIGEMGYNTPVNSMGVAGNKLLSVPLIFASASAGTYANTLLAIAGGMYDADISKNATTTLNWLNGSVPIGGQTTFNQKTIYVRFGWEENQNNGASSTWCAITSSEPTGSGQCPGDYSDYIAAFRHTVTLWRSVFAGTGYTLQVVWCPTQTGQDIALTDPGPAYYDVLGVDVYLNLGSSSPQAAFAALRGNPCASSGITCAPNTLYYIEKIAAADGRPISFPEWGVEQDNYGEYLRLWYNFMTNPATALEPVVYWSMWDDNAGGVTTECDDGNDVETCAMVRHLFNYSGYRPEPIPAPVGIAAAVNGSGNLLTITANVITDGSSPVTGYRLYESPLANAEGLTAVQSITPGAGVAPSFTVAAVAGHQYCFRMAGVWANGNVGFQTGNGVGDLCVTPVAPNTTGLTTHYLVPGTGNASTSSSTVEGVATQ